MVSSLHERALLPDRPSKAQYAKKYEWTLTHSESCQCLYCVLMQTICENCEALQRANMRNKRLGLA